MTALPQASVLGREIFEIHEIDSDRCGNRWGNVDSPCTAGAGNLLSGSQEIQNSSYWSGVARCTITGNIAVAPDGTTTGAKVVCDGTADPWVIHLNYDTGSALANRTFNMSIWLWTDSGQPTEATLFIIDSGYTDSHSQVVTITTTPTRYDFTATFGSGVTGTQILGRFDPPQNPSAGNYLYAWGAQLTETASVMPYTKTTSAAVAANSSTGQPCFNTYNTCQDKANYNNSGIKLDGTGTSNATITAPTGLVANVLTVEAFVKFDSYPDPTYYPFALRQHWVNSGFFFGMNPNGELYFSVGLAGAQKGAISSGVQIPLGRPVHIVGVLDSTGATFCYIDAVKYTGATGAGTYYTDTTSNIVLGQDANGHGCTPYYIRAYGYGFTDEQVWTNFKNGNPYAAGGAVIDIPFVEGSGTTAADYSGNGNDFALNNTAWTKGAPFTTKLCTQTANVPKGMDLIPCIDKVTPVNTRLDPGQSMGKRAGITATMLNFPFPDRMQDPYWKYRTYDTEQGTFWGRWKARNKFYNGREYRRKTGYLVNGAYDSANMKTSTFFLERVDGPEAGKINFVTQDALAKLASDKLTYPVETSGTLDAALASGSTADFSVTGDSSLYDTAGGRLAIDSEIISYTSASVSGDTVTFTGVTRQVDNTDPASHSAGASVQMCGYYSDTARNITYDLIVNQAGIDSSYINTTDWDAIAAIWMQTVYTRTIPEPTGILKLIEELCMQAQFFVWWDEETSVIKLDAVKPPDWTALSTFTDSANIIKDSIKVRTEYGKRISRVAVAYNPRTPFASEDFDLWDWNTDIESDAEGQNEYNQKSIVKVYARWLSTQAQANKMGSRVLAKYRDNIDRIIFELDAKDDLGTGDFGYLYSEELEDIYGGATNNLIQVIQRDEVEVGHTYRFTALASAYEGRFGFIAPAGEVNYSAATDIEKLTECWIGTAGGANFSDGGQQYGII